ncbi:uncharacterized protein LOC136091431 [Hydra vulgaris]|uniref:Uncharacterized protein LOC136091431 n=1 Tax=Hydra vulgaris TaxID=6087 RepID=A0ABM4DKQ0_HYDVU
MKKVSSLDVCASSKIELYVGNITEIEEYDVLVISAFPGDYEPSPGSVIGALYRDLKVSVAELSKNKEEVCKVYSSWWSKQLNNSPMNRILCYEGSFLNPTRSIAEVFGTLVALGKNDLTVVMPLLGSGDQNYSKEDVMKIIFKASTCWMQAGFPIKLLKIVVYARNVNNLDASASSLRTLFSFLITTSWRRQLVEQPQERYDIYMSYTFKDRLLASEIVKKCEKLHNGIRIKHPQCINENEVWQEEIYKAIMRSSCVIALISSEYLNDSSCIEQFNIALCSSRYQNSGELFIFYVAEISLPSYMGFHGFFDCREGYEKVMNACKDVCRSLFGSTITAICPDPVENNEMLLAVENEEMLASKSV